MKEISDFVNHINSGGLMAYPTETLWGLGADVFNSEAVDRICEIKGRGQNSPISVLIPKIKDLENYCPQFDDLYEFLCIVWPGPLTVVLPVNADCGFAKPICGSGYVGFRVSPKFEIAQFLAHYQKPLTTTSANLSGQPAAQSREALSFLNAYQDVLVYQGEVSSKKSAGSTVVKFDLKSKKILLLRDGDFPLSLLKSAVTEYLGKLNLDFDGF